MAAAEARAAWQRTANRCLVQEDAKRAPKLACCPSSSTEHQETTNENAANTQDHPIPSLMPLNWNPTNSNLPPDTKWWLQLQPNFGYQQDFIVKQTNLLENKPDEKKMEPVDSDSRSTETFLDTPWMVSTAFMKHTSEIVDPLTSKKTERVSMDVDAPWVGGGNKCQPWWRITDQDELASLVAQKSMEHIENCDLPRPTQTMHVRRDPLSGFESMDDAVLFSSSSGQKSNSGLSDPIDYVQDSYSSGSWSSGGGAKLFDDKEKLHSGTRSYGTSRNDPTESKTPGQSDPSRAELLEALRHSQTRARKAEMAAQKAYNEKDHIVKLLFKQASHLFAYKQWLQMLQLESLCLQLKIKDNQIATLFPILPWMPLKEKPSNDKDNSNPNRRRGKKKKNKKCNFCRYAVVFAVGLSLAGAGILLGWTLGCLIPQR
ncbi:uncharacterized protein LOC109721982 [Ananas comosus]|uniref:Uncharacterized protein LOC109721982 n=1 Tax=Ananas comosus TaxID=4615 RepID=A0A6P5GHB5_ANACO|nr:uncharacterized protein LOC109721982 [Ananas comosus]XP_020105408.1 uncharacterized protein LOC109721982 [Ananas comosus]XP_020105409.1 uncharacterized protein LOC109721982 [Ananas comosus]XP_020105411.1 uncharacterized protein LOC109721982 [Ananas comosus]